MENIDRCVCCGEIIPEGQMACPNCMVTVKKDEKFILIGGKRGGGKIHFLEAMVKMLRMKLQEVEQDRDRWKSAALYYMEKAKANERRTDV